jgi:hypothetical protein
MVMAPNAPDSNGWMVPEPFLGGRVFEQLRHRSWWPARACGVRC